jgi:phosphohistidine phosphatase SixA
MSAAVLVASVMAGAAGPGLVKQLQGGGLVLVLRHAVTDQSKQDEDPVDLADCATQRNLSADGRAQARAIARAVRRLKLSIGTVLTSRFCRTRETARLAFGRGKVEPALLNTINAAHDAAWSKQMRAIRRLIGTRPAAGTLTVLVTHGVVVTDATNLTLEEGETLVFRPHGNSRFQLVGRIEPDGWSALRKPAASRALRVTESRASSAPRPLLCRSTLTSSAPDVSGTVLELVFGSILPRPMRADERSSA